MNAKREKEMLRTAMWMEGLQPAEAIMALALDRLESGAVPEEDGWWEVLQMGLEDPAMNRFIGKVATEWGDLRILNGQWEHNEIGTQLVLDVARGMSETRRVYEDACEILTACDATIRAIYGDGVRSGRTTTEEKSRERWHQELEEMTERIETEGRENLKNVSWQARECYKRRYGDRKGRRVEVLRPTRKGVRWGRITDVGAGVRERILIAIEEGELKEEFNRRVERRVAELLDRMGWWAGTKRGKYPGEEREGIAAEVEPGRVERVVIRAPTWSGIAEKGIQQLTGEVDLSANEGITSEVTVVVGNWCGGGIEGRVRGAQRWWDAEGCIQIAGTAGPRGTAEELRAIEREAQRLEEDAITVGWGPGTSVSDIYALWRESDNRVCPELWEEDIPTLLIAVPNGRRLLNEEIGDKS